MRQVTSCKICRGQREGNPVHREVSARKNTTVQLFVTWITRVCLHSWYSFTHTQARANTKETAHTCEFLMHIKHMTSVHVPQLRAHQAAPHSPWQCRRGCGKPLFYFLLKTVSQTFSIARLLFLSPSLSHCLSSFYVVIGEMSGGVVWPPTPGAPRLAGAAPGTGPGPSTCACFAFPHHGAAQINTNLFSRLSI